VKDPVARRYFRTGPDEWSLARLLDGTRTVAQATRTLADTTGTEMDEKDAAEFVRTLAGMGFLECLGDRPPAARSRRRWNPLFVPLPLGDPNRLLGSLAKWTGPLFHPVFVATASLAIAAAAVLALLHLGELRTATQSLLRWPGLLYLWIPALAVIAIHEFAHGVACRRFGAEVHEMGVVLYLFQPCAFCDVSDSWMVPSRAQRLWIVGAGPFFEAFLWALAVFAWRFLPATPVVSAIAVGIAATSGLKTLFNLNPLIKLDGYFLLSDALGIPNLRARAFRHAWDRLRRRPDDATPFERAVFLAYAPLAAACTAAFIAWFVVWFIGIG